MPRCPTTPLIPQLPDTAASILPPPPRPERPSHELITRIWYDDSWATADLDVNDDGVVDGRDLEALDQAGSADDAEQASAS